MKTNTGTYFLVLRGSCREQPWQAHRTSIYSGFSSSRGHIQGGIIDLANCILPQRKKGFCISNCFLILCKHLVSKVSLSHFWCILNTDFKYHLFLCCSSWIWVDKAVPFFYAVVILSRALLCVWILKCLLNLFLENWNQGPKIVLKVDQFSQLTESAVISQTRFIWFF